MQKREKDIQGHDAFINRRMLFTLVREIICLPLNTLNARQNIASKLFAQMPLIGPHGDQDVIAELLLLGKKPLGWIMLGYPHSDATLASDATIGPQLQHERDLEIRLDEAVMRGQLKSADLIVKDSVSNIDSIYRYYAQPDCETDLRLMVAYNQQGFNKQESDVKLGKSIGDHRTRLPPERAYGARVLGIEGV